MYILNLPFAIAVFLDHFEQPPPLQILTRTLARQGSKEDDELKFPRGKTWKGDGRGER